MVYSYSRRQKRATKLKNMFSLKGFMTVIVPFSLFVQSVSADTLCGAELVDALNFVCGDGLRRIGEIRRRRNNIVEECCFRKCSMSLLMEYCPEDHRFKRDVSATSVQLMPTVPVVPVINKDVPRKPLIVKYSKYEIWQRKAAQRLRTFHRPLISLPSLPSLPPTEQHVSH